MEVDLGKPVLISRLVLDWEKAYAKDYIIQAWSCPGEPQPNLRSPAEHTYATNTSATVDGTCLVCLEIRRQQAGTSKQGRHSV